MSITTGLVSFVPHIIEADTDEAAVLFPYGSRAASAEEQEVGNAAHAAGLAMLTEWQEKVSDGAHEHLVPLLPHQERAIMVGLLRLRYQAATAANIEWLAFRSRWAEQARQFRELAEKAQGSQGFATSIRYQI